MSLNLIVLHNNNKLRIQYDRIAKTSLALSCVYFIGILCYQILFENKLSFNITTKTYKNLTKSQPSESDITAQKIQITQEQYFTEADTAIFSKKNQRLIKVNGYYLNQNEKILFNSPEVVCQNEICNIPKDFNVDGKTIKYNAQQIRFNMNTQECLTKKKSQGEYNSMFFSSNRFECVKGGSIFKLSGNANIILNENQGKRSLQADTITINKEKNIILLDENVINVITTEKDSYKVTSKFATINWEKVNKTNDLKLVKFIENVTLISKDMTVNSEELYYNDKEQYMFSQKDVKILKEDGSSLTAEFFLFNKETETAKFFDNLDVAMTDVDFVRVVKLFKIPLEKKIKQERSKIVIF